VGFAAVSVALELALGLLLALALPRAVAARGPVRTLALIPWALPTVVAALLWRFLFDGPTDWLADPLRAWIPIVLADVWKTTPFVMLLLLAGLQTIDESLYEAARVDGATEGQQFRHVTLPLLLDDFIITLMVAQAGMTTLPLYIYGMVRMGITPEINAVSTVMLAISILFVSLSYYVGKRR